MMKKEKMKKLTNKEIKETIKSVEKGKQREKAYDIIYAYMKRKINLDSLQLDYLMDIKDGKREV